MKVADPTAPRHALPPLPHPSTIYFHCFSRAAQTLTQYFLPGK